MVVIMIILPTERLNDLLKIPQVAEAGLESRLSGSGAPTPNCHLEPSLKIAAFPEATQPSSENLLLCNFPRVPSHPGL